VTALECLRASMRLKSTRVVVGEMLGLGPHKLLKARHTDRPRGLGLYIQGTPLLGLTRLRNPFVDGTAAPQTRWITETVGPGSRRVGVHSRSRVQSARDVVGSAGKIAISSPTGVPTTHRIHEGRAAFALFTDKSSAGHQDDYLVRRVKRPGRA